MIKKYLSWGRYPNYPQNPHKVYWLKEIHNELENIRNNDVSTVLPFGNGRSYGDSCLAASDHILDLSDMNQMIDFDRESGIVTAYAGLTLEQLINLVLPFGWYVPVSPGTRYVTLGGAVANDVHGKNHHRMGTFGCHVKELKLYRSDRGHLSCNQDHNEELFNSTIGGLGLTGVITTVTLQLIRVHSSNINQRTIKFKNIDEFFQLSELYDEKYEYSVAWIDCLSNGSNKGRGHYIFGNHAEDNIYNKLTSPSLDMKYNLKYSLVNKLSLKIFNSIYYNRQIKKDVTKSVNLESFFYPLDKILNWNKMYGNKGFQQYQCVIPNENACIAIKEILKIISSYKSGSFLAVLKNFGKIKSPGLLSFPIHGVSLALDFPMSDKKIINLFKRLDQVVYEYKGKLYPAKDAHMDSIFFKSSFQEWERVEKMRDPMLLSRFWSRVTQE